MKLLLVEDDLDFGRTISRYLAQRDWEVLCCADGVEGLTMARKQAFDVVLLDLGLPSLDGLELLQRFRSDNRTTPVLVFTARGTTRDKVMGLEAGADDYLPKPFDLEELEARLKALIRRFGRDGELRCGLLRMQASSGLWFNGDTPLDLSPREAALLRALVSRVDRVVTKDALMMSVFGGEGEIKAETLDVLLHRLRKKMQDTSFEIVNLRNIGYLLREVSAKKP